MALFGETRFTRRGDGYVAWRQSESQLEDIVVFQAAYWPMEHLEEGPWAYWLSRLAAMGRLLVFDRRGVGQSDPIDVTNPPSPRDWALDAAAILDDAGIGAARVYAQHDGGLAAIHLAAELPEKVSRLVLTHCFPLFAGASDLPPGGIDGYRERFSRIEAEGPGSAVDLWEVLAPSAADDVALRSWFNKLGRLGASPATAGALQRVVDTWDVRPLLPKVRAPTLVVHREGNQFVPVEHARYIAQAIPGAILAEVDGIDHLQWIGDVDGFLDPVEEFLTGKRSYGHPARRLAAVLFTDLVASSERAAALGDRRWRSLIEQHDGLARDVVEAHGGQLVKSTGDGILAVFDLATSAIHAAAALRECFSSTGLQARFGIHAGEIESIGDDVTGLGVNIAARIMGAAQGGEICVSHGVPPMVAGSGLAFDDLGAVDLKGIPGSWTLHRVRR